MYQIRKAKEAMKQGIKGYLLKNEAGEYVIDSANRLPFYLEGLPGVGKTQIVNQITKELEIGYVNFSITHHTRNSLLGLPVIKDLEDGGKYTEFTISEIIAAVYREVEKGYEEGVLLLDEFSCISETILPTMLAFLQTKNIGQYALPKGWIVVLCGNPPEYNKSARRFDPAITDRMRKLEIEFSAKAFMDYGKEMKFHQIVLDYLNAHPSDIYVCNMNKKGSDELVTCRGWENLSDNLKACETMGECIDENFVKQFIKSDKVSHEFCKYYSLNAAGCKEKDIEAIMSGVNLKKYISDWKNKDFSFAWNVVELLGRSIEAKLMKTRNMDVANQNISHVFQLIAGLSNKEALEEKFYYIIADSDELLRVMTEYKNDEFLAMCKNIYGEAV